jgi:dephospho-CoA kinase
MLILGLTGGIAAGKSHVAAMLRNYGVPVFDSDAAVHRLMAPGGAAVDEVLLAFPDALGDSGGVDRRRLGAAVFGDLPALRRLERILHPRVQDAQRAFLRLMCRQGRAVVALDVPLLLETGGDRRVDCVVVVGTPRYLQVQRALRRPGMTRARLESILAKQLPDKAKRRRAHMVIPGGQDRGMTEAAVRRLLQETRHWPGAAWPDRWLAAGSRGAGR